MTDTPGWASPGSPEPPREDAGPSDTAPPAPPQADTAPPQAGAVPPPAPGPYGGAYGQQPPHGRQPQWGGQPQPGWNGQPQWGGAPGAPGWGAPGWGRPQSPKPGVIPLRPLAVGELLDGAFTTVRRYWRPTVGLSLGVAIADQVLSAGAEWWEYEQPEAIGPLVLTFASLLITPLLGLLAAGLLTMVVSRAILGLPATLGNAWAAARPQLLKLVGLTLITTLIVIGVMAVAVAPMVVLGLSDADDGLVALSLLPMLAGLVVAVWLMVQLSLAAPALMLEKQGVFTALSRSRRLVKGAWWRTFGVTLLGQLIAGLIAAVFVLPFTFIGIAVVGEDVVGDSSDFGAFGAAKPPALILILSIGAILASCITIPLTSAINVLLYVDRRIRREGLDIELARAASTPAATDGTPTDGTPAAAPPAGPPTDATPDQTGPQGS
ncbi:hypothetical protein ACIRBX_31155 [Kitasatospora sp. NPDC096147]|uniref:hypothetical protein n=1 Tax=Kitasatospora sp. NPDC096147 TaxID=3364093 RepID=UPI00382FCF99